MNTFLGLFRKPAPPVKSRYMKLNQPRTSSTFLNLPRPTFNNRPNPYTQVRHSMFKFNQPSFQEDFYLRRVKRNKLSVFGTLDRTISGFISVANLGFQKAVFVRATANQWES